MNKNKIILTVLLLFACQIVAIGQCKIENKFFDVGEKLEYDLYFKYGLIHSKAGTAQLSITEENYKGKRANKMTMTTQTSGMANRIFSINDTISGYVTKDLVPLYFKKNAHEGGDYIKERVEYTYLNSGKISLQTKRDKNGESRFDETMAADDCIYDLISVVYFARTLDYPKMKKGDYRTVEFISGLRKVFMHIEHQGMETMTANDRKKYDCVKLVLSLTNHNDSKFKDKEEAMKVYISNDKNRVIVRMEFQLKIGTTRGVLRSASGLKHAGTNR